MDQSPIGGDEIEALIQALEAKKFESKKLFEQLKVGLAGIQRKSHKVGQRPELMNTDLLRTCHS